MFAKRKILSFVCAFLLMSHTALRPININFDYRFIVGIVCVIGIIALCLGIRQINKVIEEHYKKREKIVELNKEMKKLNKEIVELNKELEKINKKIEENITENVDTLDIFGDVCVEINVDKNNIPFIKIIGDQNFADRIKMKTAKSCFSVSQGDSFFERSELLKCIINLKQLNEIKIAGNVHITKIDFGYNAMVKSMSIPPIDDKTASNVVNKIYQALPILKITTKDNSKISDELKPLHVVGRNIGLYSYDKSEAHLHSARNLVIEAHNKAFIKACDCNSVNVNTFDESNVEISFCPNVRGNEGQGSKIRCLYPDDASFNRSDWICQINRDSV